MRRPSSALAVLGAVTAACLAQPADGWAETVLRVGSSSDIQVVDPMFTTAHPTRDHAYLVYDTLMAVDSDFVARPQMLESYEVADDGMTIDFKLRPDLAFHDGSPVTSKDVVASIRRWAKADTMAQIAIEYVDTIEPTGDDTFTITMKEPSGLIIDAMAKPSGNVLFILPERIADTPNDQQFTETIGSGPFTFDRDEWIPGQSRLYRRNENYVPRDEPQDNLAGAKVPAVDVIEVTIMPDDATRQAALLAGEIDYIGNIAHDLVADLRADPDLVVDTRDVRGEQLWLRFNHLVPPFDDKKLRQAIYWALTQKEHMGSLIADEALYENCPSMFGCGTELSTEAGSEALQAKDLDKARQLVEESDYAGEPIVFLDTTNHPLLHGANIRSAETLREIGLNVELQGIAVATLHQRRAIKAPVAEGGWNIFHTTFATIDVFNPVVNPAVNTSCAQDNWPGWPCNEEIEALRRDFVKATSLEERQRIAAEVQRLAFEHGTHIPLGLFYKVDAWGKDLTGVEPASVAILWGIGKQEN